MDLFYLMMQKTIMIAVPLLIVALGVLICEKSGVINIAMEGIMVMGAFVGIYFVSRMQATTTMNPQLILFYAILLGGLVGGIFSLLHAFAAINLKANQTISGTALNIFAPSLGIILTRMLSKSSHSNISFTPNFMIPKIPILGDIPIIGPIFFQNTYISFYFAIAILIIVTFVISKTKIGLRIRACGENPNAADAAGINIKRVRYLGVVVSGVLAGMGGVIFVASSYTNYTHSVYGYGFLAIAVLIFGNWKPFRILFAASFFALTTVLKSIYDLIPFLKVLGLPKEFYEMLPYIATLVVLVIFSNVSNAPKAAGEIFDKGKR